MTSMHPDSQSGSGGIGHRPALPNTKAQRSTGIMNWTIPQIADLLWMAGVAIGAACAGSLFAAFWTGTHALGGRLSDKREQIRVTTCPITGEGALIHIEEDRIAECTLHGTFCGEICQQKSTTAASGNFDTSKLLKIK